VNEAAQIAGRLATARPATCLRLIEEGVAIVKSPSILLHLVGVEIQARPRPPMAADTAAALEALEPIADSREVKGSESEGQSRRGMNGQTRDEGRW